MATFTRVDPATLSVALVVGDPGMGKTSLVRHALACSGALGVVAEGDPAESDLEYGVLEQLVRRSPLDGSAAGDVVPLPGTDPLVAGAALLRIVDGLALDRPLVVVVDDVHWADRASLDAITFAARRVQGDQVVLCLTCRPEGLDRVPAGLARLVVPAQRRIDLGPLDTAAVAELAARSTGGPVPAAAVERLRAHTGGNPLHIGALLRELGPGELVGGARLPAPRSYSTLVLGQLAACRPAAQLLVEALAVLDRRPAVTTTMAVVGLDPAGDDGVAALDEALETGFVELVERPGERSLVFTHPLVAAAVSGDMSPSRRAELHRAAGAVVPGVAGMRHRLDGCAGHDARLAADARAGAQAEAGRGALRVRGPPVGRRGAGRPRCGRAGPGAAAGRRPPPVGGRSRRRRPRSPAASTTRPTGPCGRSCSAGSRTCSVRAARRRATSTVPGTRSTSPGDRGWPAASPCSGRRRRSTGATAPPVRSGRAGRSSLARVAAADCHHGHMLAMSCALEGHVAAGIAELTVALEPPPTGPAAVADLRLGRGVLRMWAHDLPGAAADLVACLGSSGAGGTSWRGRRPGTSWPSCTGEPAAGTMPWSQPRPRRRSSTRRTRCGWRRSRTRSPSTCSPLGARSSGRPRTSRRLGRRGRRPEAVRPGCGRPWRPSGWPSRASTTVRSWPPATDSTAPVTGPPGVSVVSTRRSPRGAPAMPRRWPPSDAWTTPAW